MNRQPAAHGYYPPQYSWQCVDHGIDHQPAAMPMPMPMPQYGDMPYRPMHGRKGTPTPELCFPELHLHNPHHHQQQQQQYLQPRHHHQQPLYPMAFASEDELAELQRASNEYQSEGSGPLVGERLSSHALTTEYAAADPVYQVKTAALPRSYSHYRTCRGDGRCGWRAIAFGYFECLLRLGDSNKFLEEEARLQSLTNMADAAGYDSYLYADFADETYGLLRNMRSSLGAPDVEARLLAAFNDEMVQNSIITHLRTLVAAYIKTRPEEYAPYVLPLSIEQYCDQSIAPYASEIEQVGVSCLVDVLLKPAGVSLEIIYLDRSHGEEVNVHHFGPPARSLATTRLLYRPGHYDILYKAEDSITAMAAITPANPQAVDPAYLDYAVNPEQPVMTVQDFSGGVTLVPGMSMSQQQSNWISSAYYNAHGHACTDLPAHHGVPTPAAPAPQAYINSPPPTYINSPPPTSINSPPPTMHQRATPSRHDSVFGSPKSTVSQTLSSGSSSGPVKLFRPSQWQYGPTFDPFAPFTPQATPTLNQTVQFKNSHFNTSHFSNPEFTPEQWSSPSAVRATNTTTLVSRPKVSSGPIRQHKATPSPTLRYTPYRRNR